MKSIPAAQIPDASAGELRSKRVLLNFTPTEMEEVTEFVRDLQSKGKLPTATLLREMILKAVRDTKQSSRPKRRG
jgi:hypothetical protein